MHNPQSAINCRMTAILKIAHPISFRTLFVRFWSVVDWGQTSNTLDVTVSCWSTWSQKNFTGCIRIWLWGRWSNATRAITWKLSGGSDRLLRCLIWSCRASVWVSSTVSDLKVFDKLACCLSVLFLNAGTTFVSDTFLSISWKNSRMTDLRCYIFTNR